jgi:predicted PurR-regulated permease PerM/uncharacterized tellurite resistance protein B-like protein
MADFSKITGLFDPNKLPMMPELKHSLAGITALFGSDTESEERLTVMALVKMILTVDGTLPRHRVELFRRLAEETYGVAEAQKKVHQLLETNAADNINTAAKILKPLDRAKKEEIICFLVNLSFAAEKNCLEQLRELAGMIDINWEFFNEISRSAEMNLQQRTRMLRSRAGVLVAVVVIAVFILTATLLRSVIFGLIIAYILLPVEKFFENQLRKKRGIIYFISNTIDTVTSPLKRLSEYLTRKNSEDTVDQTRKNEKKIIEKAVGFTTILTLAVLIAGAISATAVTGKYVGKIKNSVKTTLQNGKLKTAAVSDNKPLAAPAESAESETPASEGGTENLFNSIHIQLNDLQSRFEKLPFVQSAISYVDRVLKQEDTRNKLLTFIAKKTGGMVSFASGVIGTIVAVLCDALMAAFFTLLFLLKFAEFNKNGKKSSSTGAYIVKAVFNGKWLPESDGETFAEAERIINGTLNRLKVWVRGYLTLMLVDATVYTTLFYFIGVPYFLLLGALAGCGILLPYIGPIISCAVTLLVTLAAGDCTGTQFVMIVICYLIYNGIVEQFILYPAVIGESLGLTTLETIIVVLLGAIFAGIPGMILALPTASVAKYLVPRIYDCWQPRKG